jgi:glucosamine--fructose-6-phosphate aminotransferase (isomerizing)
MCGIVGYVGSETVRPLLMHGLAQLEYRGYDSAGIAVVGRSGLRIYKRAGRVDDLDAALPKRVAGRIGIGHTRWATHGPATDANAHPHCDGSGRVAVVHNGIIDNAEELRAELQAAGVTFSSETDTEVLAHLVARSSHGTLEDKVRDALGQIDGTYGLAVVHADFPDRIVAARNGSPLIVGVGSDGTHLASDVAALIRYTARVVHLDDGDIVTIAADRFDVVGHHGGPIAKTATEVDVRPRDFDKGSYRHFLRKEIGEEGAAAARVLTGRLDDRFGTAHLGGLNLSPRDTREFRRIKILGCGSALYAGLMGAQLFEDLARVPASAEPASEFRYRNPVIEPDTLYVAVSQSGETLDTLLAVKEITRKGGRVIGLVNVAGSSIAREVDGGIYLHAGPEISVASTKAVTAMVLGFALLALSFGRVRDLSMADGRRLIGGLHRLPGQLDEVTGRDDELRALAGRLSAAESLFFLGRVRGYALALEGAQKFKEVTYRHAEAYPMSELKHGPLALVSPDVPTVAIIPDDDLVDRNVGTLHEVAARRGPLVVVTHPGIDLGTLDVDRVDVPRNEPELDPVLLMAPLHLLAYHAAVALGRDVDNPRNLAKSVTVE